MVQCFGTWLKAMLSPSTKVQFQALNLAGHISAKMNV